MKLKIIFTLNLLLILMLSLPGTAGCEESVTLDALLKRARENNPEIKSAYHNYTSRKNNITAARSWEYPQFGYENTRWTDKTEDMFSVSQMFSFPGKLSLKGRVAESYAGIAEQELNSKIIRVASMIKRNFWEYWLIDKTIEVYQENIELMNRFLSIAKSRYATGIVTQADVLKANTELAKMESMLVEIEQERDSIQSELNALVNDRPDTPLGKPVRPVSPDLKYKYGELENIALKNNQLIKSREFSYQRSIYGLDLARREWFPDIMGSVKSGSMSNTYMAGVSLPLYFWKQGSIVRTMKSEKEAGEWELAAAKVDVLRDIRDLYTKYNARQKSVGIYEAAVIPLAKQTLEITESSYRTGKNNFLDLLDSQKRYLEYNLEYYRLVAEEGIALSDLERVAGVELGKPE
ncbi:MAG: TolC family protein [Elusimicrobia bacterium]|nr:TolC family protein [Elusimicrobiota bacterium]